MRQIKEGLNKELASARPPFEIGAANDSVAMSARDGLGPVRKLVSQLLRE